MAPIVLNVRYAVKQRLLKNLRRCRDAGVRQRYLIVVHLLNGRSAPVTAAVLEVHRTTVYRVVKRFRAYGEAGLCDGRTDYGWRRPTWTRELLVETLVRRTGVRIHPATMSRARARIKARRGRPKQTVGCPW